MTTDILARPAQGDADIGFEPNRHSPVPTVDFDYGPLDPAKSSDQDPAGDREILKIAFSLLLSPAPAKTAAARVCLIYKLLNPGIRTVDTCRLFHGVRRDDVNEAHRELAALLSDPNEKKAETAPTVPASEKSNATMYEKGASDEG